MSHFNISLKSYMKIILYNVKFPEISHVQFHCPIMSKSKLVTVFLENN